MIRANEVYNIKETIKDSDKIVIYGSSIGKTDKYWWRLVGRWLSKDTNNRVCLFTSIKSKNTASATVQIIPPEYKERFISFFDPEVQKAIDSRQIQIAKYQEWMFQFSNCIEIESQGLFKNMIIDEDVNHMDGRYE